MSSPDQPHPSPSPSDDKWKLLGLGAGLVLLAWLFWNYTEPFGRVIEIVTIVAAVVAVIRRIVRTGRAAEPDDAKDDAPREPTSPSARPSTAAVPPEVLADWGLPLARSRRDRGATGGSSKEGMFADGFTPDEPFPPSKARRARSDER